MVSYCLADKMFVRDLPGHIFIELGRLLNPKSFNNWAKLAGLLGFTSTHVQNFGLEPEERPKIYWTSGGSRKDRRSMFLLTFSRKWSGTTVFKCWRNGAVKVRENGWQKRAAWLAKAMFCVLPATFKPVAGCEKLLQKVQSGSTFCNKICTCARFTGPRQTCFAAGYVTPAYGVTRA